MLQRWGLRKWLLCITLLHTKVHVSTKPGQESPERRKKKKKHLTPGAESRSPRLKFTHGQETCTSFKSHPTPQKKAAHTHGPCAEQISPSSQGTKLPQLGHSQLLPRWGASADKLLTHEEESAASSMLRQSLMMWGYCTKLWHHKINIVNLQNQDRRGRRR